MMAFLAYDLRVAILIAVFYMFYRLLLSRDSLHELNRFVLLSTALASFVLPLCVITIHHTEVLPAVPIAPTVASASPVAAVVAEPWWHTALLMVYWTGVIISFCYIVISISKVCILISRCEKHRQADGTVIAVSDGDVSPFSWMHTVVVSRSDYAHLDRAILLHEREHIRRHHSWDVVLVSILSSLQWFNPAMWMLRADLRAVHEYEADAAVLSSGVDARQYQYLLVRKAMAAAGYSVANGINHSTLKQRITMMNTQNRNKYSWLKALYVVPIVAVSLAATAKTVTDYQYAKPAEPVASAAKAEAQPQETLKALQEEVSGEATVKTEAKQTAKNKAGDGVDVKGALIVVDGKQYTQEVLSQLNPKDIVSIDVLKNKSSLALFGDKGKNGVILITTKSGKADQQAPANGGKVFAEAETMPNFPGGSSELMKYLATNVKYPASAVKWGVQGRVVVNFIVNADGSVSDARVVYNGTKATVDRAASANPDKKKAEAEDAACEQEVNEAIAATAQEAVRVVESMPKWTPGTQKGEPVRVAYNVPISFKIQ